MTKYQLLLTLTTGKLTVNGVERYVRSIEREDGSGHRFNVYFTDGTSKYFQTID